MGNVQSATASTGIFKIHKIRLIRYFHSKLQILLNLVFFGVSCSNSKNAPQTVRRPLDEQKEKGPFSNHGSYSFPKCCLREQTWCLYELVLGSRVFRQTLITHLMDEIEWDGD